MNPERIAYGGDASQFFEVWHPEQAGAGFAVFIHGGFWRAKYDLSHANPFCAALAERGIITANLEYRRVGQPGGGWPGTFEDVVAGTKAASEHLGRAPVVVGHSAGGHLASPGQRTSSSEGSGCTCSRRRLRLAYDLNLSNGAVVEFLGVTLYEMPGRYDEACASTRAVSARRFIVHGTKDEDVPIDIARAFMLSRQTDSEPPSLLEIPDAGHMDLIDPKSPAGVIG